MREEHELMVDIDNAKQATAIVEHPLYIASLELLRELTIEKFESLVFDQTNEMRDCNTRLKLIEEFKENLLTVIMSGGVAFNSFEEIQNHKKAMNNER